MEFWEEIKEIGKLYVEEELVVGIEPVLMVCVDASKSSRYLVMTYDSGQGEYVLCRVSRKVLIDMLENRKTMEETFRAAGRIYKTTLTENGLLRTSAKKACEFPAELLPDKGAFYDISSEYIQKYIATLKSYQNITDSIQMEIYELIKDICLNLSKPERRKLEYDLDFHQKKEYNLDYLNVDNNKYSTESSKYFAA